MHEGDHTILDDQHEPDGHQHGQHSRARGGHHGSASSAPVGLSSRLIAGAIVAAAVAAFILWRVL